MTVSIGKSFAVMGIDEYPVTVEVDIRKGLPSYSTVGLPDKAISESKNRINAAIKNSGYEFSVNKIRCFFLFLCNSTCIYDRIPGIM